MAAPKTNLSEYILPNDTGVCLLECKTAFEGLTPKERMYAHYIAQAAFNGGLIVLLQTSPESPGIYLLFQKLFRAQSLSDLKELALKTGLTEAEYEGLLIYAAGVYSNMGNYKSFGDSKFIPTVPKEKFKSLVFASAAYEQDAKAIEQLWNRVGDAMYSLTERNKQLGLGQQGISTYFSGNCDLKDAEVAQKFLDSKELSAYNTRLFKTSDKEYEIRLASSLKDGEKTPACEDVEKVLGKHEFTPEGSSTPITFTVTRGDYAELMNLVVQNVEKAAEYAANSEERNMMKCYAHSFTCGSICSHKDGSRHWIKDKGPIVETYIGFIESYRDPFGVRGEFEGFAAMVNKEMSAKFARLVDKAEDILPLMPWPAEFEKDTFLRPDFTSLDVLAFGGSGIPAGINIPNYDDIRQSEGFKNVSLGNVIVSGYKDQKVTFLEEQDVELYVKYKVPSFEVQVGLHELLGHGSGKLFIKEADGKFNFDVHKVINPLTGSKIEKWYEGKETWDSKFPVISSSYEECRAECVGLYLCLSETVLSIFGHSGQEADDLVYINWLNMVRAGFLGLEFYSPQTQAWKQAHMNARFVILRVLLEAGNNLVTVQQTTGADGEPDVVIHLDRTKIHTVGKKAIGDFLQKLQIYKSTADYESAKAMYDYYSKVSDDQEPKFQSLRDIVIARKQSRKMFVQCNTKIKGDTVELVEYEASPTGVIQSFKERFPSTDIDDKLQTLWDMDSKYFENM
ncbi:dipeptidyl peptidase 3 [Lingula anatina]|uniref:Dipeptidyl peptidase 3 n=1 Tax=Lingula anatina TaxID=7574 RepID=A0A1S3IM22_LINAN|nr:dipeptidyl peptidase 3 [Lingula anatina]XP_013399133.2 dipeptidyl peptidase 3 [Lingula anatina]|eukprot:XP_013399132.2 dipeptidyl peptidase 3 [Lingula anatina]